MTVQSMNNFKFGSITGFNSYRSRGVQTGGMLSYNNSIYGGNVNRYGSGSRFYNPGALGTSVQFGPPPEPETNGTWWKTVLNVVGGAALGWLLSGDNAQKTGNWVSNLFSGNKDSGTSVASSLLNDGLAVLTEKNAFGVDSGGNFVNDITNLFNNNA